MTGRPRVGISRCLLGDAVRYDATHRRDDALLDRLDPFVEWVPVCPEVEIGMGTPREPIRLVASGGGVPSLDERVRLVGVGSGEDWTGRMQAWARERVKGLKALGLAGYILKASSPSCGISNVRVFHPGREGRDDAETRTGRGLFAQALIAEMPGLPVEDEERLKDPRVREEFVARVLQAQGLRPQPEVAGPGPEP